jgi:hypothetical protein
VLLPSLLLAPLPRIPTLVSLPLPLRLPLLLLPPPILEIASVFLRLRRSEVHAPLQMPQLVSRGVAAAI